ncbi:MAG TPA: 4Fe-4S ferredoxin, partial [Dialister sp.]|nr:4Fe-4S ferredoxin [Dialister sp.]
QKEGKAEVRKEVQTAASTLSMDDRSHIVNNVMKCIFCGMCERNCPAGAITVDRRNRTWRINLEACVNCGTCIDN